MKHKRNILHITTQLYVQGQRERITRNVQSYVKVINRQTLYSNLEPLHTIVFFSIEPANYFIFHPHKYIKTVICNYSYQISCLNDISPPPSDHHHI